MSATRIALVLTVLAAALMPARADAQWYPLYPGYPGYYRFAAPESDLKFDVKPKDAAVYIDGYFAGQVDDYNGTFERLHVAPGEHEIVVYLEGYRSLRRRLYLSPNRTRKVEGELEKLKPGDPPEPMPVPDERPGARGPRPAPDGVTEPRPPTSGRPAPRPRDRQPQTADGDEAPAGNNATLSIRVQPGGAIVLIDGEQWQGPGNSDERLIVQVPEGRHTIEVRRDGYEHFVKEIEVRRGRTETINISLVKSR